MAENLSFGMGAADYAPIPPVSGGFYQQPISMQQMGYPMNANNYDMGPYDEQPMENEFDPQAYATNPILSQRQQFRQR